MERRTIETRVGRIPVWTREGGGAAVLVVHGGPDFGSAYLRHHLPAAVPRSVRLHFLDLPGTGRARDATVAGFADVVAAVGDAVDTVGGPLVLAGHSFGALPALAVAAASPPAVVALLLLDPDPPWREAWSAAFPRIDGRRAPGESERLAALDAERRSAGTVETAEAYLRFRLRPYFHDARDADALELGLTPGDLAGFGRVGSLVRDDPACWDVGRRLDRVRVPTLIVTGPASVYPPESLVRLGAELPEAALVSLAGTGHFSFLEEPDAFGAAVGPFLERAGTGPT